MAGQQNGSAVKAAGHAVNGWNAEYLDDQYARFRADPDSLAPDLRAFFRGFDLGMSRDGEASTAGVAPTAGMASRLQSAVEYLVNAYRDVGHLAARLDPFGRPRPRPEDLALSHHGLSEADLDRPVDTVQVSFAGNTATLRDLIAALEETYCGSIGVEFSHIASSPERQWFLDHYEKIKGRVDLSAAERTRIIEQLARAEGFERFIQKRYQGEKRFSLEGGESLIPLLDRLIDRAGELGAEEIALGMAHRGRLNVLNNIMGKSYEQIFTEFEDNWEDGFADGGGDVKYHRGYSGRHTCAGGREVYLSMASNPSHLESVDPVVQGRVAAKQWLTGDTERRRVIPVLIHGDAAIAGQGVVAECLNYSQLEGYRCGGTIHIVVNNMIGFTTNPEDARSSVYCTDVAKSVDAPIFHVNAEDPEAVVLVARLAVEFRQTFRKDVMIDLWCYRKYGHNEQDEQSYTQPILARLIADQRGVLTNYADRLVAQGVVSRDSVSTLLEKLNATLDAAQQKAKHDPQTPLIEPADGRWRGISGEFTFAPVKTAVSVDALRTACEAMARTPEGFNVNPKLKKLLEQRGSLWNGGKICHADGEMLAFATLLLEGTPVRLSGQDCRRGTFSQRHAVLRDAVTGRPYEPLNHMRPLAAPGEKPSPGKQARLSVYDSPLSEMSVMGFDYGYSLADPHVLVCWEGQFGDFVNGAQVIIDQYLASSEAKWDRWSGLVLLLPHGYEGAGPEHSSGRLERFLQLCAANNLIVTHPTTGAQIFHLLRRQVHASYRKPLIVMTPKSMLRRETSGIEELASGGFREIIDDPAFDSGAMDRRNVSRVVLCSGKVYYELAEHRDKAGRKDIAIVRVEQIYPLHTEMLGGVLAKYPATAERVWAQEEPRNMGAFMHIADAVKQSLGVVLSYAGRPASATPAVGSKTKHKEEQHELLDEAIGVATGAKPAAKPAKPGRGGKARANA